jgi:hypothetical protein
LKENKMPNRFYAVRDSKVGAYSAPQVMRSDGEALRAFADAVNDKQSPMGKYPEDYSMWRIGDYDEETGIISALSVPECIGNGVSFVR